METIAEVGAVPIRRMGGALDCCVFAAAAVLASWFAAGVLLAIQAENAKPAVKN